MRRLATLLGVAAALVGTVAAIGTLTDWRWPLERHELDNPASIKYALEHPQPYAPTHPTDRTSRVGP